MVSPKQPTPDTAARSRLELTDPFVRGLKATASAREYRDTIARGLIMRVLPSGLKQFSVRYRHRGKQRRAVLGVFPALSLSKARTKASRTLLEAKDGQDPAAALRAAKAPQSDTVRALAADYLKRHAKPKKRSAAEDERILDVDVLPRWGDLSVRDLSRRDVRTLIERVVDRGAPVAANRTLAVIRKMLNFAVDHDWIDANPAARISKPSREVSRERVLTDEELRRLWRLLSHFPAKHEKPAPGRKRGSVDPSDPLCPVSESMAALLKVRLLTAQRGGEVTRMRWQDVDLEAGWWTIPGNDTKNGEAHRVPLTADAVEIIKAQLPDDDDDDDDDCAVDDDKEPLYVFVGRGGEQLVDRAKKAPSAIAAALEVDFRGHDLRRTAATRMAAAGIPRDHIAKVLNHVEGGARATRVYDRHSYDAEKLTALQTWARSLTAILTHKPKAGANVVLMRRRK